MVHFEVLHYRYVSCELAVGVAAVVVAVVRVVVVAVNVLVGWLKEEGRRKWEERCRNKKGCIVFIFIALEKNVSGLLSNPFNGGKGGRF